jgi:NitT/TauT family transport system substrate-binding protein
MTIIVRLICSARETAEMRRLLSKDSRRRFLLNTSALGFALLFGLPHMARAEQKPETITLRVKQEPFPCEAPVLVAQELLRAEGFSDVRYVKGAPGDAIYEQYKSREIDLGLEAAWSAATRIDVGDPFVLLAGIHAGCFELIAHEGVRKIHDLKGKVVVVPRLGGSPHQLIASMVSYVGLDPHKDIQWLVQSRAESMQSFIQGKADAFLWFPPYSQQLRAKKIGHVLVSTTADRPWSQYFCCMVMANREFVRDHPVATKRALRALLKANGVCAVQPKTAARLILERGWMDDYDLALSMVKEMPYGRWREYDPEDTVRFFALRLHEAGLIKSTPNKIIAQGTDWRFLNELKKELKA